MTPDSLHSRLKPRMPLAAKSPSMADRKHLILEAGTGVSASSYQLSDLRRDIASLARRTGLYWRGTFC